MHDDLVNLGWTEDHLSRIRTTVAEEAQRARVLAQALPLSGPEDGSTIAVPEFKLGDDANPVPPPSKRLEVDSQPTLPITTIAINVQLRSHEIADPSLTAALVQFRRAANYIARVEDALIVNGRPGPNQVPPKGIGTIPGVYTVHGAGKQVGLWDAAPKPSIKLASADGNGVFKAITDAISKLDSNGYGGPYAALLGTTLFELSVLATPNLVLPRDRILPFLQGPLLRVSAFDAKLGAVVSLSGNPIEIVVASDIGVRYLQTTLDPRYVFRVTERVAFRVKESEAIALIELP
jgi:uncharacterized linocin/CFP29 family protein